MLMTVIVHEEHDNIIISDEVICCAIKGKRGKKNDEDNDRERLWRMREGIGQTRTSWR